MGDELYGTEDDPLYRAAVEYEPHWIAFQYRERATGALPSMPTAIGEDTFGRVRPQASRDALVPPPAPLRIIELLEPANAWPEAEVTDPSLNCKRLRLFPFLSLINGSLFRPGLFRAQGGCEQGGEVRSVGWSTVCRWWRHQSADGVDCRGAGADAKSRQPRAFDERL
jgi:hypothetical protein